MDEYDIERLERAIDRSYHEGKLDEQAKIMLEKLSIDISKKEFKLDFGGEVNKQIRKAVLKTTIRNWKGFYASKQSISAYFINLSKLCYNSEIHKIKRTSCE